MPYVILRNVGSIINSVCSFALIPVCDCALALLVKKHLRVKLRALSVLSRAYEYYAARLLIGAVIVLRTLVKQISRVARKSAPNLLTMSQYVMLLY